MSECPSCADLRADVDHWRGMAGMYLAAAKAGIAAKAPDAARDRLVPSVAAVTPPGVCPDVQPDLRALDGRTA